VSFTTYLGLVDLLRHMCFQGHAPVLYTTQILHKTCGSLGCTTPVTQCQVYITNPVTAS